ncbi:MAG: 5-bromo-4-chloroindolyl phosphate hydrolysis family protein [Oscillospiraceae bacterium]
MKKREKKSVAPIYIFILVWLLCSLFLPLYRISGLLITAGVSIGLAMLSGGLISSVRSKSAKTEAPSPQPAAEEKPQKSYGPEVDAIIADGKTAMKEMGRLYSSINDQQIRSRINELMRISDKIVQDAIEDSSDVPQIRKFLNYYLPTTIKLLNAYDRMSVQGIEGENLSKSMSSIEAMLDTAIEAYKKQLDSLFENQALDIETDISVMNRMLAREGLTDADDLGDLIEKAKRAEEAAKRATAKTSSSLSEENK